MSERIKTWKVRTSADGVVLTVNGKEYELGTSAAAVAFEIDRAASGVNPPEKEHHER